MTNTPRGVLLAGPAAIGWPLLAHQTDHGQMGPGQRLVRRGHGAQVCPGTGQAWGQPGVGTDLKSQQDFYINLQSSFSAGDQHGQAPLLWSASALLRSDCPGAGQ